MKRDTKVIIAVTIVTAIIITTIIILLLRGQNDSNNEDLTSTPTVVISPTICVSLTPTQMPVVLPTNTVTPTVIPDIESGEIIVEKPIGVITESENYKPDIDVYDDEKSYIQGDNTKSSTIIFNEIDELSSSKLSANAIKFYDEIMDVDMTVITHRSGSGLRWSELLESGFDKYLKVAKQNMPMDTDWDVDGVKDYRKYVESIDENVTVTQQAIVYTDCIETINDVKITVISYYYISRDEYITCAYIDLKNNKCLEMRFESNDKINIEYYLNILLNDVIELPN